VTGTDAPKLPNEQPTTQSTLLDDSQLLNFINPVAS
jgi:hypothetical protein